MDINSLLDLCKRKGYEQKILPLFKKALVYAKKYLTERKRLAGDTHFDHNLRVAKTLVESFADSEIVIAGILNGILRFVSTKALVKEFGLDITSLVEGVSEIHNIKSKDTLREAESIKKVLLSTLKDIRVLYIKLASKLDNLQSLKYLSKDQQKRITGEVFEIYSPLAYRLGMEKLRVQLEDSAFKVVNPRRYHEIVTYIEESQEHQEEEIEKLIKYTKKISKGKAEIIEIKGRPKHIYSIYNKVKDGKNLREIFDFLGMRIIVPEVKDCYNVLGLLHEKFEPIDGRLKDYIASPKPNFYRSIHTCLKLPTGKIAEVQIRTKEMDEFAEEGIAAHWRYKKIKSDEMFEKKLGWLKKVLERQKDSKNKEFLESVKVDIFGDKIYCYTPKGDVKELPKGASILDFAFSVHVEVGNHAVAGRVNGKFVRLRHELKLGDVVEILTNKNQRPRRGWLKFVRSSKAKQRIRKSIKEHDKLPALHYRLIKPEVKTEQGTLVESEEFPKASCILAKCCHPIPGNEIVGILTKRRIVSVHQHECRAALKEENRWIPVNWKEVYNQKIRFHIFAEERSGLLADLLHTIASASFEVKEAKAKLIGLGDAQCSFLVIPRDFEHLKHLIKRVMKVRGVRRIYFE